MMSKRSEWHCRMAAVLRASPPAERDTAPLFSIVPVALPRETENTATSCTIPRSALALAEAELTAVAFAAAISVIDSKLELIAVAVASPLLPMNTPVAIAAAAMIPLAINLPMSPSLEEARSCDAVNGWAALAL